MPPTVFDSDVPDPSSHRLGRVLTPSPMAAIIRRSRLIRIQHARIRTRALRRLQVPPVIQDDSSSGCSSDGETTGALPASPPPSVPRAPTERIPAYDGVGYRYADDPCCKATSCGRTRRESLIDIAMRTVVLMRRNQQLQLRLAALQAETRDFIQCVMNNPENQRSPAAQSDSDYNSASPSGDEMMHDENSTDAQFERENVVNTN